VFYAASLLVGVNKYDIFPISPIPVMLPTVVTTNDTLEELEKHVGQRIISRLMETCQGLILDGEDFRKEAV